MEQHIYPRWQRRRVEDALKTRRVVLLEGPRQSGKTTLSKAVASGDAVYRTLDDQAMLKTAKGDPVGFVQHGDELMVIDEVQRAPDLLLAIKKDVDENIGHGRFLLTGSANIQSLPSVRESLAGRVAKVRLRTLGMGELGGGSADFIANAFEGRFKTPEHEEGRPPNKDAYIRLAMRGGFPEAVAMENTTAVGGWHRDYLAALVDRDLGDIAEVRRRGSLLKLVEILAAWSSREVDKAKIGAGLTLDGQTLTAPTIEAYINALMALYLVESLEPWRSDDYDRIKKRAKLFMADSGLMSSILNWNYEEVRFDGDLNGKLVETFVYNQLTAILGAQREVYNLFHYRDRAGREVDFLVQNQAGDVLGMEVKAGSAIEKSMFRHLDWFRRNIRTRGGFKGIVLYTGEQVLPFGEDMWAVPISALWA